MGPARTGGKGDLGELANAGANVRALPLRQQSDGRAQSFEPAVKSGGDQKYVKLKFTKISVHGLLFFYFCNEVEYLFAFRILL
jgi:hypothetical protein